jgi:hypothetical protein
MPLPCDPEGRLRQRGGQAAFEQPGIREADDPCDQVALDLQHHPDSERRELARRSSAGVDGIGSAVNDATRWLGSTLGVAVIGSVYASLYNSRLSDRLPAELAPRLARTAHNSVGGTLALANRASVNGHPALANSVHAAASNAFFHGFSTACLVAAGVSAVAAIATLVLLPAHPATGLTLALQSE